jgi:hypothetical protein
VARSGPSGSRRSSPHTPTGPRADPVKTPGQNVSRERGFGTLTYERLFTDEIDDAVLLAKPR